MSDAETISQLNPAIANRWSTVAFAPQPLSDIEVDLLLRAAQWAPSANNRQPWRFIVVRGESARHGLLAAFSTGNAAWAHRAPLLLVATADPAAADERHGTPYYAFDCGLACQNAMIQAAHLGLASHPTIGWNEAKVREVLGIPEGIRIVAIIAIGRHGTRAGLDEQTQAKLQKRRERKPLPEVACRDYWGEVYRPVSADGAWEAELNRRKAASLIE